MGACSSAFGVPIRYVYETHATNGGIDEVLFKKRFGDMVAEVGIVRPTDRDTSAPFARLIHRALFTTPY